MQNAPRGASTFIKLHVPFVIKILVLSIFEWPFSYTCFTVYLNLPVAMAAVRSKAEILFVVSLMFVVSPIVFGVLCLVLFLCHSSSCPFKLGNHLAEENEVFALLDSQTNVVCTQGKTRSQ